MGSSSMREALEETSTESSIKRCIACVALRGINQPSLPHGHRAYMIYTEHLQKLLDHDNGLLSSQGLRQSSLRASRPLGPWTWLDHLPYLASAIPLFNTWRGHHPHYILRVTRQGFP
ncbi:uncharacterized protein LACBIDRAFT_300276 [Laccaria bicolor S238N-H82]|uniref:Predicted protein n=1 Tax=Laccaria bicolor (strain S238N-H82 / ATCC MYA-4686) TaxID=486041 RepID=B0DGD4_LACBS|nr:uncharacterized protein LACBIDRAFT_300276 [Laccaria bicolor S238N-H82]EDR06129.1 predicted protein [Laccaria bicolor S238N-H82]|eukprot:XP_001882990.1 predicted protein [Laccaria bicolor S238N-H82]